MVLLLVVLLRFYCSEPFDVSIRPQPHGSGIADLESWGLYLPGTDPLVNSGVTDADRLRGLPRREIHNSLVSCWWTRVKPFVGVSGQISSRAIGSPD